MRVLIIEDSAVFRRLIETCFREYDAEFESQRLPHSSQRLGGFPEADLVVIGVYQPFSIGLGVIERLRSRVDSPGIVAITTDTREKSIRRSWSPVSTLSSRCRSSPTSCGRQPTGH